MNIKPKSSGEESVKKLAETKSFPGHERTPEWYRARRAELQRQKILLMSEGFKRDKAA